MSVVCDLKDLWKQFLDLVQNKCSSTEFDNWFSPIKILTQKDDILVLQVPNIFVREYILDNYREDLLALFSDGLQNNLPIEFKITTQTTIKKVAISPPPIKPLKLHSHNLNKNYTFENFIEGPSNQFVKSAAIGIAAHPGKSYNPFIIHGGVGLGKSHLLHSIGHAIQRNSKNIRILCITTEEFINDLVHNLKNKSMDQMKRFYRNLDVLLIDDIQFLQNRLNFEDELCNTFEALINQHKQIVITSDKPPSCLQLSERLVARMEWGLVANVCVPDLETRVAIIQHKAEQKNLLIPNEVAFYIAEHIYINVRQIEGAINRLCAFCRLMNFSLTLEVVEKILAEILHKNPQKKVTVEHILKAVSNVFEIRIHDIKGDSRLKKIALARQIAMFLAKEYLEDSLQKIATSFGGKTHSTVLHAWKKITTQISCNEVLKKQVQIIKKALTG